MAKEADGESGKGRRGVGERERGVGEEERGVGEGEEEWRVRE